MRIEHVTELDHPVSAVLAWMSRPGALVRLTPPGVAAVEDPTTGGLDEGRVVSLRLGSPILPTPLRPRLVVRHEEGHLPRGEVADRPAASPYQSADETARALAQPVARVVDRQLRGPFAAWRHEHRLAPLPANRSERGRSVMGDTIEVELSGPTGVAEGKVRSEIDALLAFRARQMRDDLAFWAEHPLSGSGEELPSAPAGARPLTVAMSGASGMVGTQLAALLRTGGIRVVPMRRARLTPGSAGRRRLRHADAAASSYVVGGHNDTDGDAPQEILWDPERGVLDPADLAAVDAVIHLAGASIATRFTDRAKQRILRSRVDGSALIARTLAGLAEGGLGPRTLIQASAIGAYGAQRPGEILTEDDPGGTGFLADVVRAWEGAAHPAVEAGVRTVFVRTGVVLSDGGGPLAMQLPLFRVGAGGRLTRPDAMCSWITLDDLVRVYAHALLTEELTGPVNAVAPAPASAQKLAKTLGTVLQRPSAVPVPPFGPRLLLGSEGAKELVEADQTVSDERLRASGFCPAYPRLEPALRHVLRA